MEEPYRRNELWYLAEGLQQYGDGRILSSAYLSGIQRVSCRSLLVFTPEEQRDRESRGISVKEYPAGDLSFLFEIPAVNSQGTGGEASYIKINKGDDGFRMKLWFDFRN